MAAEKKIEKTLHHLLLLKKEDNNNNQIQEVDLETDLKEIIIIANISNNRNKDLL